MIGNLNVADVQKYYVGQPVYFPKRNWLARLWQRIKIFLRIGGYMTVVQVDYERGTITVDT